MSDGGEGRLDKRRAYGYRDEGYFIPENPRRLPRKCTMNQN